jgi:type II secretory pathway predicted ATPase ExeA
MKKPFIRTDIFGMNATPFLKAPDKPYLDDNRNQCLQQLGSFLQTRGFAAIAGRPGNGKTALVRYFTENLHKTSHKIIYIPFSNVSENDLLKDICSRLEVEPPHFKNQTIRAIQKRIADIQPINPVIVLDEMQNANSRIMDAVRLLANDNFDAGSKLSVILIGTNEFFDKLRLAINESLTQRITWFHRIQELSHDATVNYITHCLKAVGVEHEIFEKPAIKLIYDLSGGSLRIINKIALTAMSCASSAESSAVLLEHVHTAKDQCLLIAPEVRL